MPWVVVEVDCQAPQLDIYAKPCSWERLLVTLNVSLLHVFQHIFVSLWSVCFEKITFVNVPNLNNSVAELCYYISFVLHNMVICNPGLTTQFKVWFGLIIMLFLLRISFDEVYTFETAVSWIWKPKLHILFVKTHRGYRALVVFVK